MLLSVLLSLTALRRDATSVIVAKLVKPIAGYLLTTFYLVLASAMCMSAYRKKIIDS